MTTAHWWVGGWVGGRVYTLFLHPYLTPPARRLRQVKLWLAATGDSPKWVFLQCDRAVSANKVTGGLGAERASEVE